MNKFYDEYDTDFRYPEIGICMEETWGPTVKIGIPIATPTLSMNRPYDSWIINRDTRNIVSDQTAMDIKSCIESNYITMQLPSDIHHLYKGDRVILIFIGGDINKPEILRRYYNG